MMRHHAAAAAMLGLTLAANASGPDKIDLSVLYVGNPETPRAADFVAFLEARFTRARAVGRTGFDPAMARDADVVLLDWSQRELDHSAGLVFRDLTSPLGEREAWEKPTVLLGSAGLLTSAAWQTVGSYG